MTRPFNLPRTDQMSADRRDVEALSAPILQFLAEDDERFGRFLDSTGLTVATLRGASASAGFAESLFDYLGSDERLMVGFAQATNHRVEDLAALHGRLAARARGG